MSFNRVAIIGVGHIGSSIARGLRQHGLATQLVAFDASPEARARLADLGIVDEVAESATAAVQGADLVFLCMPVGAIGAVAAEIGPHLAARTIVTDVGSVKGAVVAAVCPHIPAGVHFIPGHPIAGTELSGPDSGFADLFANRWCILTPLPGGDEAATARLEALWEALGSHVERMEVAHHDMVLAITSHLPHIIAYSIVSTAGDMEDVTQSEIIKFSAGGFRDFTRIAASNPIMWRDIFLNNRDAVLEILGRFSEDLAMLQRAIRWGDGETLEAVFTRSREIRRSIVSAGQDTATPNFGRKP